MRKTWQLFLASCVALCMVLAIVACNGSSGGGGGGGGTDGGGDGGGGDGGGGTSTVNGSLAGGDQMFTDGTFFDAYILNAVAGQVIINMISAQIDCYLVLFQGNGDYITEDDDGGDGFNSRITFDAAAGQNYFVIANSFAPETGSYTLSVSQGALTPTTFNFAADDDRLPASVTDWSTALKVK